MKGNPFYCRGQIFEEGDKVILHGIAGSDEIQQEYKVLEVAGGREEGYTYEIDLSDSDGNVMGGDRRTVTQYELLRHENGPITNILIASLRGK